MSVQRTGKAPREISESFYYTPCFPAGRRPRGIFWFPRQTDDIKLYNLYIKIRMVYFVLFQQAGFILSKEGCGKIARGSETQKRSAPRVAVYGTFDFGHGSFVSSPDRDLPFVKSPCLKPLSSMKNRKLFVYFFINSLICIKMQYRAYGRRQPSMAWRARRSRKGRSFLYLRRSSRKKTPARYRPAMVLHANGLPTVCRNGPPKSNKKDSFPANSPSAALFATAF